jgi:hypothetical protein
MSDLGSPERSAKFAHHASIWLNIVFTATTLTYIIIECGQFSRNWPILYWYTPSIAFLVFGWWNYLIGVNGSYAHEQGSTWERFKVRAAKWPTIVYTIAMGIPYLIMFQQMLKVKSGMGAGFAAFVTIVAIALSVIMASSYPKPERNR